MFGPPSLSKAWGGVTAFLVIAAAIVFFLGLSQIKEILDSIFSFLSILLSLIHISAAMCRFKFRPCENKVLTLALHNGRPAVFQKTVLPL